MSLRQNYVIYPTVTPASLVTSQNVTAPKRWPFRSPAWYCLVTSQNVTAPKRRTPYNMVIVRLVTSQNVTAPKQKEVSRHENQV